MKRQFCCLLVALLLFGCVGCDLLEDTTHIVSFQSPANDYTLTLYQIGSPQWSFGSVQAKLVLTQKEGDKVQEKAISFNNDGGGVAPENVVNVVWGEDAVEVEVRHFDTTLRNIYTIPYDGREITCVMTHTETEY